MPLLAGAVGTQIMIELLIKAGKIKITLYDVLALPAGENAENSRLILLQRSFRQIEEGRRPRIRKVVSDSLSVLPEARARSRHPERIGEPRA